MKIALSNCSVKILIGVGALGVTIGLFKLYSRRKEAKKRKAYPKDVVILHQYPPGSLCPNISPYCLKLETWLRMADIKYQNEFTVVDRSNKGKLPYITLNGIDVADSQFCIEYLTKKTGKDLSEDLNLVEKSIARSFFKMVEESLKWCIAIHRYLVGRAEDCDLPRIIQFLFSGKVKKAVKYQGYGAHSLEEMYAIGKADLKALENFIGNKKYLFGDKPCNEDACVFAFICQLIYLDKGPFNEFITKQCPNLMRYHENIKQVYWSDWDQVLSEAKTKRK